MYKVSIEFTSPKKWFQPFACIVRCIERTRYSHVRLRWQSTTGEELVYEASGSSVKLIGRYAEPLYPVNVHHSYEFALDRQQYRKLISMFKYAGVQYGILQIVGIGLARLFGLRKNPFADGQYTQVCSELVGRFLTDVLGKDIGKDLDLVGPRGLKEFLDNNKENTNV